jgi:hypothetical protein
VSIDTACFNYSINSIIDAACSALCSVVCAAVVLCVVLLMLHLCYSINSINLEHLILLLICCGGSSRLVLRLRGLMCGIPFGALNTALITSN